MKYIFAAVIIALCSVFACPGYSRAEDNAASFTNATSTSGDMRAGTPEQEPAKPATKSLTRMLREYEPEDVLTEPETDENVLEVEVPEQGIRFDEKETYKGKSGAGYRKTKEDFADPKSIMTK